MTTRTHDHEIVIDSTTRRLNLARDKNGRALCTVTEDVPQYNARLEIAQKDWTNGHGHYEFDDPKGYFEGQSIDTSIEGKIILGPGMNSTPIVDNFLDGAQADDGGAFTNELTASRNGTANDITLLPAVPAPNDAYYFGSASTFSKLYINVGTAGVGTWDIVWEFWNGSTWTTPTVTATSNVQNFKTDGLTSLSFSVLTNWTTTAVNGVTLYWIRARVDTYSAVTTQPKGTEAWVENSTTLTFGESPVCFLWSTALGLEYVATASKIYEMTTTAYNATWRQVTVFASGTISDMVEYNGVAYIALGASTYYQYTTDMRTFTATDLTDGYAIKFLTAPNAAGTANVLWKAKTVNEISSTTNGKTVAGGGVQWTSPAYIGDTSNNIVQPFLFNDELMIGRTDNLYNYDNAGGIHALMDELKEARSTNNFKYVAHFQSGVYFSLDTSIGELIGSSPGIFSRVGPLDNIDDISKTGVCVGLSSDSKFLYAAIDEGTNTHIYRGRPNEDGRWNWCPWIFLSTTACATIAVSQLSPTIKRLFFGYGNTAAWAQIFDNPLVDSGSTYATSGYLRMSYIYGNNPFWDKMVQTVVTETANCAAGITITPKYRKDTDTSASALTSAITTNGVVKTSLTSALSCKRIQFELHLATNDTAITPQVRLFIARGVEKPETVRTYECVYDIGSDPSIKGKTFRTFLRGGRTSTSLIKLADLRWGEFTTGTAGTDYHYVVMQPGYPKEDDKIHETERAPEDLISVRWQEVVT